MKIKRNALCHCESKKKFKDCHGKKRDVDPWKKILIYVGVFIILIWFTRDIIFGTSGSLNSAPPGKVWSDEHGHYHDINTNQTPRPNISPNVQRNMNIPQPDGPTPEGKVWSIEHGHWHDVVKN